MTGRELEELCSLGENTTVQFKLEFTTPRQLIDRPDGNQFIARIWRTTQKDENATQKANEELCSATQNDEYTTQKGKSATLKPLTTAQKEILAYLKEHPTATRQEVAEVIGNITEDGVKYNIGRLQQYGVLKRVGGRKQGRWEVVIKNY